MQRAFTFVMGILLCQVLQAQKISGVVKSSSGELLPYASIIVKGTSIGTTSNAKAKYSVTLPAGTYTLICQHIGYQMAEETVVLSEDRELNFILKEQKLLMKEVVVKSGAEDPAYEIIRQAIRKRPFYLNQVNGFQCDIYGKDLIRVRNFPDKFFGQKVDAKDKEEMGLDSSGSGILYLSESLSTAYSQKPDKFRMDIKSSRVSGSNGFGFTFPAFISFYNNNVTIFSERLNPRGFVSPIADGAIHFYKYKFLGTFWENGKAINSIRVTPRRQYEPLFSGIINITDEDWRIHSTDLLVTKTSQLELLDSLNIRQLYVPVSNDVWRVKNQVIHFNAKQFKLDIVGDFLTVYSDYKIDPVFDKKRFNNVVIKYDTAVNKKSKSYWDTIRPVPLEPEEVKDYKVKDSTLQAFMDSSVSKRSLDSMNRNQSGIKPLKLLISGYSRTIFRKEGNIRWGIDPILLNASFNNPEGLVLNVNGYVQTYLRKWKAQLLFEPYIRYGFSNGHINPWASLTLRKRQLKGEKSHRYSISLSGGKQVSEFNREGPLGPMFNSISILFYGKNFIKTYENYFGRLAYMKRFDNGFQVNAEFLYEDRIPIENTTTFSFRKNVSKNITPNYPNEKIPAQFTPHQAAIFSMSMSFRPGQKYIQLPRTKIPIGSKYPLMTLNYSKGFKAFGSDVDFDKWQFTVSDDKNLKLAGLLKYKLGAGGFLNRRQVFIQDYQHFNGNQTIAAGQYLNTFQLAPYYANSNIERLYGLGHVEYHFNGLLTNKIPLFRRLNWSLVGGGNAYYVNRDNNYAEAFIGLENIFKIFRVDLVGGYVNGRSGDIAFRIGAGGALGSSLSVSNSRSRRVSFSFRPEL